MADVEEEYQQSRYYVEYHHSRHDPLGYLSDPLDTAYDNRDRSGCDDDCRDDLYPCSIFAECREGNLCCAYFGSYLIDGVYDTVYLCGCSDTESSGERAEESEHLAEPFPLRAHALFNVVERSAEDRAVFLYVSVLNSKNTFCILCCDSEECSKLHPEKSSRTAAHDSCGYTYDVSCTYCSSEGCCESSEAGYVSLCAFLICNGVSER